MFCWELTLVSHWNLQTLSRGKNIPFALKNTKLYYVPQKKVKKNMYSDIRLKIYSIFVRLFSFLDVLQRKWWFNLNLFHPLLSQENVNWKDKFFLHFILEVNNSELNKIRTLYLLQEFLCAWIRSKIFQ